MTYVRPIIKPNYTIITVFYAFIFRRNSIYTPNVYRHAE